MKTITRQITIFGVNYTGHHFRMIECNYDSKFFKLTIEGDDQYLVDFILDNLSYGNDSEDDHIDSLEQLIRLYNEGNIPVFDGCGGLLAISLKDGPIIYQDSYMIDENQLTVNGPNEVELLMFEIGEKFDPNDQGKWTRPVDLTSHWDKDKYENVNQLMKQLFP